MSKLSILKARQVIKILKKLGFVNTRIKGSHYFFKHQDGRTTVIPVHSRKTIGPGLLRSIMNDIKISQDEFKKYLYGNL